jgi:Fe2+ or Zn2+ uptake regulation protein
MDKSILLEVIGDTTENRIIDLLIEGRGLDYSKTDIANNCEISRPTLYKILPMLVKKGIVKSTRSIGRVQLYAINASNGRVKALLKLEEFLLRQSFEETERIKVRA